MASSEVGKLNKCGGLIMLNKENRLIRWMVLVVVIVSLGTIPIEGADKKFHVNPIKNMPSNFIRGADISTLYEIEDKGGIYKNKDGKEEDLLKILKDSGVNWVRLRLWNDPYDVYWSDKVTANGEKVVGAIGGGTNDLKKTIAISKRAQELGLKVLLDFHYSDFWADPGKQYKPKAWNDLTGQALEDELYNYTKITLEEMEAQGTLPDMVQVGNEINGGMVWPEGKGVTSSGFVNLLKRGTEAVRDVDPNIEIMLHLAEGGDKGRFIYAFDAFEKANIDYDIIGASFYSFWHGTLKDLQENLDTISARYNKEVIVAETAYGYTLENFDSCENNFDADAEKKGGYQASVQGQATAIRDVMETVVNVPGNKGRGIFYWEPAWIPVEGAGWLTGEGSGWENQAMFDQHGKALPSLNVFNLVSGTDNNFVNPSIISADDIDLYVEVGNKAGLPDEVEVLYSDGSFRRVPVKWEEVDETKFNSPGKYTISGLVQGYAIRANVTIKGAKNLVKNPGFESGTIDPWMVVSDGKSPIKIGNENENSYSGSRAMNYWSDLDINTIIKQEIEGIEDGNYVLKVWLMGESEGKSNTKLFAESSGVRYETKMITNGWNNWGLFELKDIRVVGGKVDVGIIIDEEAGSWGWIDDFALINDEVKSVIKGPELTEVGSQFEIIVGIEDIIDTAYASDIKIKYDSTLFNIMEVVAIDSDTIIAEEIRGDGEINVLAAHTKGVDEGDLLVLKFKAKDVEPGKKGGIEVEGMRLSSAPKGSITDVKSLSSHKVTLRTEQPEKPEQPGNNDWGGAGGGSASTSTNKIDEDVLTKQNKLISSYKFDKKTGLLSAGVDLIKLEEEFDKIEKKGVRQITIDMPDEEGAKSFSLDLPVQVLQSKIMDKKINIKYPFGTVTLPNTMLNKQELNVQQITLRVKLIQDKKRMNKPIVELEIMADGKPISWQTKREQVEVVINYAPEEREEGNLEHIIIYYLNENEELVKVPNANYNEETSNIIFKAPSVGQYLVGYDYRTFEDLDNQKWAKKSIEVLASKGIIRDIYKDKYYPEQKVSRAEYYDMIVTSLGLSTQFASNFDDIESDDYYYETIGIAKELGIAKGTGDNRLNPNGELTREDAIIIIERTLQEDDFELELGYENVLMNFVDNKDISDYATQMIANAVHRGVVHGSEKDGELVMMPKASLTKAEAVALVHKRLNIK